MSKKKFDSFRSMSKKKKFVLAVVILIVAIGAFRVISSKLEDKTAVTSDVVNIKVTTAAITTLESTSPLTGRLEPVEEVALIPKAMGEVTNVYVELGQKVAKGTVLFDMDKTQVATTYNQAKVALNDASVNLSRTETLFNEGAVSQQQYEAAKTTYTVAKEAYTFASDSMNNYVVTAPIDGYITSINVNAGAIASQAAPAVTIANIDKLEIDTSLSEALINKIKVGDKVDVLVSSASDTPFTGTVTALSPAPAAGSLTYPMKVTLDNVTTSIKPGMFAEVVITSEKTENVIALPSSAVLIKSGKTVVAVIEDGKVKLKDVVLGVDNGDLAEIKSGVKAGDTIVIKGQEYLEENSEFNIIE
ncbi:efflux RND transporter periplasmic adaptor subunit [Anoxybacterium hadale]|uniref:Efflux RND transporter periplasmic adaptor subunit n=1 Tax=Anoxybacterium hadale TaxID=3408580 RepID=A0ACD1A7M4_9FIRM|nr:efflux RND transporter periplasmic adaptor subunit [Clostridiales bacterium]